jgi:AAA+ ATPase superfamily predicted ATPase
MELPFTNRTDELKELEAAAKAGGLLVVFGRRRVGKTRLLTHWLKPKQGLYSQAIEAAIPIQVEQVMRDLGPALNTNITPKNWTELLELFSLQKSHAILCLDEFPYLVASDPSLPSVLQRWLDHQRPKPFTLVLAGSSTRAMNDCFLNRAAPLYQRARKLLHVEPMTYRAFCTACGIKSGDQESFTRFALVGGIPKYWEFIESRATALDLAEELFFGRSAFLEDEPARTLRDENIAGLTALSVLEAVGRGAEKSSEIAARLGTAQTNLGRTFQQLLDASVLAREIPFGESLRSTKKTRYRIQDPALRFWFQVYSPHRTRWPTYGRAERQKLIHDHAATVFEDFCRAQHPVAARYWEANVEFDYVRDKRGRAVVSEVKFKHLSARERRQLEHRLAVGWQQSALSRRFRHVSFEILDASALRSA